MFGKDKEELRLQQSYITKLEQSLDDQCKTNSKLMQINKDMVESLKHCSEANSKLMYEIEAKNDELESVNEALKVYIEMQENLNQALSGNPGILDIIEVLQTGGDTDELQDLFDEYDCAMADLKKENETLKHHIGLQHDAIGEDLDKLMDATITIRDLQAGIYYHENLDKLRMAEIRRLAYALREMSDSESGLTIRNRNQELMLVDYEKALQRCHNAYLEMATKAQDMSDSREKWMHYGLGRSGIQ